ncbi:putative beta-mannosidase [Ditylenchus destructor]|uniref:beta-mannosidase n=1 Tax=Ditylenchus destructor TaxID=166010 RepID=A0AAD4MRV2_9BILA|nr:putative beta-mannosidase [Ditylenchus destructor]
MHLFLLPHSLRSRHIIAILLTLACSVLISDSVIVDLGGEWKFHTDASDLRNVSGLAQVPGDIFTDLQALRIIGNPLYGEGDEAYRWVGRQAWTYERNFSVTEAQAKAKILLLHLEGLDTIASVFLNGEFLLDSSNQFVSHVVNVRNFIRRGLNHIRIEFESPVQHAKEQAELYKAIHMHKLPPDCSAEVQNGECGINFLRKIQASFSWDWGPSFPTMGIWKPIYLEYHEAEPITMLDFYPTVIPQTDSFILKASIVTVCTDTQLNLENLVNAWISIEELNFTQMISIVYPKCTSSKKEIFEVQMEVPKNSVELWCPRGHGKQNLYTVSAGIALSDQTAAGMNKKVGFRTIELVQTYVNDEQKQMGRNFYFKVNDVPIFLKGTNWIPISAFPARNHSTTLKFMFHSMAQANMNALRVWGGGMYETEEFYELADEYGILIWQDLMFACALYPTSSHFLGNVKNEVTQQVLRLRHHPSILVWAGNNENEIAIAGNWWAVLRYTKAEMIADYKVLYNDLLKPLVNSLDTSRPFLLSSPSNGVETEAQGGFSEKPGDPAYGDIHFYNDVINFWKTDSYQTPRCATEFGVQSLPMRDTMLKWIDKSQWQYGSRSMTRRQHHGFGIATLLWMIFQHFEVPRIRSCKVQSPADLMMCQEFVNNFFDAKDAHLSHTFMDDIAFLSQIHQAIAMQSQTEHYRRWRSRLNPEGLGHTMCAMYWQLNDVWAAPSWSSIDFNLNWKMLHYFARRFFAPVIISMYIDDNDDLNIFIVSDNTFAVTNATFHLEMFVLGYGFQPIYATSTQVDILPQTSRKIDLNVSKHLNGEDILEDFVFRATVQRGKVENGNNLLPKVPTAILLPDKLHKREKFGKVFLNDFQRLSPKSYVLGLNATNIAPVVWLDLKQKVKDRGVLFHFSDNAFAMVDEGFGGITLEIFENPNNVQIVPDHIVVKYL